MKKRKYATRCDDAVIIRDVTSNFLVVGVHDVHLSKQASAHPVCMCAKPLRSEVATSSPRIAADLRSCAESGTDAAGAE